MTDPQPTDQPESTDQPTAPTAAGHPARPPAAFAAPHPAGGIRISDADRERAAERIREAASEGRLTLEEADERQRAAYEARFDGDLTPLTADLPAPPSAATALGLGARRALSPQARRRLMIHASVGAVLALIAIVHFVLVPVPFFFPAGPIFWIAMSLAVHYLVATRRQGAFR